MSYLKPEACLQRRNISNLFLFFFLFLVIAAVFVTFRSGYFTAGLKETAIWVPDSDTLVTLRLPFKDENNVNLSFLGTPESELSDRLKNSNSKDIVLTVGDSNLFFPFGEQQKTLAQILEQALSSKSGRPYTVINGAIYGYGPDQNLLRAEKIFEKIKYKYLLFHVFADNDLGDLLRNKIFIFKDSGVQQMQYPGFIDPAFKASRFDIDLQRWRSRFFPLTAGRLSDFCESEYRNYKSENPPMSNVADHYDLDVAVAPDSESAQLKIKLFIEVMSRLKKFISENKIKTIVLIEPSKRDLSKNIKPNFTEFSEFKGYNPRNIATAIEAVVNRMQLPVVNLYSEFSASGDPSAFFQQKITDDHWNQKGVRVAVDRIYPFILDLADKKPERDRSKK